LDHPNVLSLIGASINTEDGTLHMIMPFMHHGDLKSFLKSKGGNIIEHDHYPKVCIKIASICSCIYIVYVYMYVYTILTHLNHTTFALHAAVTLSGSILF